VTPVALLGESSGWLVAALTAATIPLPYLLRGRLLAPAGWSSGYLERLRPHYWIGFTLAGLVLLHAVLAMSAPFPVSVGGATGLWVATGVMLLLFGQVYLGVGLQRLRGRERLRQRRLHFWTMTLLVAGSLVHVVLNGPVVRALLGVAS
jgi:hypothetical protein